MSHAGLVPIMALAEKAGLSELIDAKVKVASTRVKSAGVNRAGGMRRLVGGVYPPATLGQLLREFPPLRASHDRSGRCPLAWP